jgi:hypothetical protein
MKNFTTGSLSSYYKHNSFYFFLAYVRCFFIVIVYLFVVDRQYSKITVKYASYTGETQSQTLEKTSHEKHGRN